MIPNPTDQSGIRPDYPVMTHIQTSPDSTVALVYVSWSYVSDGHRRPDITCVQGMLNTNATQTRTTAKRIA